ncbi:hypothetical protein KC842_01310 [Candidatus Nomurabacteria bacterium]|nr:hypothetical protein [Candidatus Nomurabacteria bacterium]USN94584.1 MAG: hypothetical protein H6791_02380 [Candidatus Nomurabacteria bacterium]
MPKKIKEKYTPIIITLFFTTLFGVFILHNTKAFRKGVVIEVNDIENGQSFYEDYINVSGQAKHSSEFYINGRVVNTTLEGEFGSFQVLNDGVNMLVLESEDKFGNRSKKEFIIYKY